MSKIFRSFHILIIRTLDLIFFHELQENNIALANYSKLKFFYFAVWHTQLLSECHKAHWFSMVLRENNKSESFLDFS